MPEPHPPCPDAPAAPPDEATVLAQTRAWVDHAVIGLNLCPFAKAVQAKGLIRYVLCRATDTAGLRAALADELRLLAATPITQTETTVLVHPWVLQDFLDFNHFLAEADRVLRKLRLDGELQIASFHPHYRFADAAEGDIANTSNRSPWPTLHLIREASIDRAVAAFPEAEAIYETNIASLRALGTAGWQALARRWHPEAVAADRGDAADPPHG